MHDTLRRLHGGRRGTGTTIDRFRLNEIVSQVAFGGRRGRVYRRIVALAGVRPGDAVLDVGCSSGYLARKLAAAAGPDGHVAGMPAKRAERGHCVGNNQAITGIIASEFSCSPAPR